VWVVHPFLAIGDGNRDKGIRGQGALCRGTRNNLFPASPNFPYLPTSPYGMGILVGLGKGAGLSPFFNSIKMS